MRFRRGPGSKFLINRNVAIEKISKINGENINNFFNNIELGFCKYVLLASGISNSLISLFCSNI